MIHTCCGRALVVHTSYVIITARQGDGKVLVVFSMGLVVVEGSCRGLDGVGRLADVVAYYFYTPDRFVRCTSFLGVSPAPPLTSVLSSSCLSGMLSYNTRAASLDRKGVCVMYPAGSHSADSSLHQSNPLNRSLAFLT